MELQTFEVQICANAETRGLEMAVLVKAPLAVVSVISQLFHGDQVGFRRVFDNLAVKHIDALRKQIQSFFLYHPRILKHTPTTTAVKLE